MMAIPMNTIVAKSQKLAKEWNNQIVIVQNIVY